jgi:hypothetical protein
MDSDHETVRNRCIFALEYIPCASYRYIINRVIFSHECLSNLKRILTITEFNTHRKTEICICKSKSNERLLTVYVQQLNLVHIACLQWELQIFSLVLGIVFLIHASECVKWGIKALWVPWEIHWSTWSLLILL